MNSSVRAAFVLACLAALPAWAQDHWTRLTTPRFELYTTADQKKARDAIMHFERVREFFLEASPVKPPGEFPIRIVAFKDPQMFRVYAPNQSSGAYYLPGPMRDSIVMQDPSPENYPVMIHEYFHLVVRHSGLHIPLWLHEGWAQVYQTLKPVKDGVAVGDLIPDHMTTLARGGWLSLNELQSVDTHSTDYNESSRVGTFYAESWALAHMLYLSPDYKDNFRKFIGVLNKGGSLDEALRTAFNKTSLSVFVDLQNYLSRKKLYGTVFLTPFEKSGDTPVVAPVSNYDEFLMLADLHAGARHLVEANRLYRQLQTEDPRRPDAFEGSGYLAFQSGDKETARKEFAKALALGTTDPRMCLQLATLDRDAKQPPQVVMADLDRAVQLQPDFSDAVFELAMMKVDARDFDAALTLLGRVGNVAPDRMTIFRSAIAYCNLQKGNVELARGDAEAARRAARLPPETQGADRLLALIDARSKGPAAAHPGEKLVRAPGTAVGMRCAASGSGAMSKMGITIDGKQMLFDMPDPAAVEITRQPTTKAELKCGPLQPFHLIVEYTAASVANKESAGLIRRLEY